MLLPLHDYGAFSQGSCTSDIVTMPSERKDKDSIGDIARAEQSRFEKIVEVQLLQKLQNNVKKFCCDARQLERLYQKRAQEGRDNIGGYYKKRRKNINQE